MAYRERLYVPWWAWLLIAAVGLTLAAELAIGAPALRTPLLFAGLPILGELGLLYLSRLRVAVSGGELWVDDAHLPVEYAATVTELSAEEKRDLLGVSADPLAFVIQRPWIRGTVRVDLNDPADPTPYWIVSTRHPARLAAAIKTERAAVNRA